MWGIRNALQSPVSSPTPGAFLSLLVAAWGVSAKRLLTCSQALSSEKLCPPVLDNPHAWSGGAGPSPSPSPRVIARDGRWEHGPPLCCTQAGDSGCAPRCCRPGDPWNRGATCWSRQGMNWRLGAGWTWTSLCSSSG